LGYVSVDISVVLVLFRTAYILNVRARLTHSAVDVD